MHKIIDGKRIMLSAEEQLAKEAEWSAAESEKISIENDKQIEAERLIRVLRAQTFSDEVIAILKPELAKYIT